MRSFRCLAVPVTLISIPILACGNRQDPRDEASVAAIDTIDGVVVVRNDAAGLWRHGEGWTLETEWQVGELESERDELLFGGLLNIALRPRGEAFAIDWQRQRVTSFDPNGEFLREVGRGGRGPGEFDGPLALAWDAQHRLWIPDGWNQVYHVFDSTGVFVKSVPRRLPVARFTQIMSFDGPDMFLDELGTTGATVLAWVDTMGTVLDTLPAMSPPTFRLREDLELPRNALSGLGPFMPRLVWTIAPDRTIWFASSAEFRLIQRVPEGDTLRIIEARHREYSLTPEDERRIREQLDRNGLSREDFDFARQVIRGIQVLEDGHIIVHVLEPTGEPGRNSSLFDVFDPEGRYLGSMRSDFDVERWPVFRNDAMIAMSRGEMDVHTLVRARIRRPDTANSP